MSENSIKIDTSSIFETFKQHINLKDNNRILFTAPFGTGKTTFLDEFFEVNKEKYNVVKLYPVNYSVSQNEDVFELIKFDLLYELTTKYKVEDIDGKINYSFALIFQMFLLNGVDLKSLAPVFVKQFGKIGKATAEIYEEVKKQYEVYEKQITETDEDKIADFLTEVGLRVGSPYEFDPVSAIIQDRVNSLSSSLTDKESILIIDDLDRLDPEHIFRLFNVFSVHFNQHYNTNKFGFDKIIFVCDINNIKHIYHHKYGKNVDFAGYIDKFYSISPFEFEIHQFIKDTLNRILINNIQLNSDYRYALKGNGDTHFLKCLRSIIISLLDFKKINLRMLIHPKTIKPSQIETPENLFNFNNGEHSFLTDFEIIVMFYVLKSLYGSFEIVEETLSDLAKISSINQLSDQSKPSYSYNNLNVYKILNSYCLPFHLTYKANQRNEMSLVYEKFEDKIYSCKLNKFNLYAHFSEGSNYIQYHYNFHKFTIINDYASEFEFLNPYTLLYETFKICKERGAIS